MNADAPSSHPPSRQSPTHGYVSPGSDSKSKLSIVNQKRASRAGTRSVTTLSAAQLERKRANDREAQRAIRQRTKDHIETLERRINELTIAHESRDKLMAAVQQRNRELEDENIYLRNRLGGEPFTLNVAEAEVKEKSVDYNVSAPTSSPQPQLAGSTIPRPSSTSTSRSVPMASLHESQHPDSWRGHHAFPSSGGPNSSQFLSEASQTNNATSPASWRAQEVGEPQARIEQSNNRNFAAAPAPSDRGPWISPTSAYGYQVRQGDRQPNYSSAAPSMSYPAHSQPPFQSLPGPPNEPPPVSAAFHAPGLVPQGEYPQMSSYTSSQQPNFHEQQPHPSYQVHSAQVSSAGDYHGAPRGGLAPPQYNPVATSPQYMPSQPDHGHSILTYREGNTQHPYAGYAG